MNDELKILFSILVHENNLVIENLIQNIQKYVKHPIIVLHANASFTDFDETIPQRYSNVHVNPTRFNHVKFTSTLGILASNFYFSEHIEYDYHCIFHSNMMFIKHGIEDYYRGTDASYYSYEMKDEQRSTIMCENSDILSFLPKEEILNNFAEGTHCSKKIFKKIIDWVERFNHHNNFLHWPGGHIEEVVIPTLTHLFADRKKTVKTAMALCANVGDYEGGPSIDKVKEFLIKDNQSSDWQGIMLEANNVFFIKRVRRSLDDPLRQFINGLP
jgi:hypothetical protein